MNKNTICKSCKKPLKDKCDICASIQTYAHDCTTKETYCLECWSNT